jgi:parallel beta-helix repeat protein
VGDLWAETGKDIRKCIVPRINGQNFNTNDWILVESFSTKSATVVVAANDSQNKNRADFVVPDGANNAQVTISNAINSLPAGGGKVVLLDGTYIVDNSIILPSNTLLEGQGNGTIIKFKDQCGWHIRIITNTPGGATGIVLKNFTVDGNKEKNSVYGYYNDGIYFSNVSNSCISGIRATNNIDHGIHLDASSNNVITDNVCQENDFMGIFVEAGGGNIVTDNTCQENGYHGLGILSANNMVVNSNVCQGNDHYGIYIVSDNNTVTSNSVQGNGEHGIYFYGYTGFANHNTVTGNVCTANSQKADNFYDNIHLYYASHNNIQNNVCRQGDSENKPRYGIRINDGKCVENIVTNNDLYQSGVSGSLSDAGTGTITTAGNRL